MARTGGRVPIRFDAAVTATRRVRGDSTAATASAESSPVCGSNSAHRTLAPAACAASTQGRMFASWSSRDTTISSPGAQRVARVRARSNVSAVMLRPNTTPPGSTPSRSPMAARAAPTIRSALRSAAVTVPRLASGVVMAVATAAATGAGVSEPPGESKWA